jgi:hypothetical protein
MPSGTPPSPPPAAVEVPALDFRAPAPPDIVEAPVLEFRIAPSPEPDPRQLLDAIQLPDVAPLPTAVEAPVLDMPVPAAPAAPDPRLVAERQPGAWMASVRRVAGASTEVVQTPDGLSVQSHAEQWLCALWPPQGPGATLPARWPELAALVEAETAAQVQQQLLAELPGEALLWVGEMDADWRLVAELVLQQDIQLRPAQARALRELAEAERQAALARLGEGYELHGRVARRRS